MYENDFDNLEEEYQTILMTDDETGEQIEFTVIEAFQSENQKYLLVIESTQIDDDEAEAIVLKELPGDDENDVLYGLVEDDDEFERISKLLKNYSDEYDIE